MSLRGRSRLTAHEPDAFRHHGRPRPHRRGPGRQRARVSRAGRTIRPRAGGSLLPMLGSPHDAEDIAQETLLKAWRSLERFERRSSVQTWLYRIATNACLDELERRPRRPSPGRALPGLARLLDAGTDRRSRRTLCRSRGHGARVSHPIQRLPGRQRAVLILRDVLGWTGGEVADLLDTTGAAVNSALQRARATIEEETPARSVSPVARPARSAAPLRRCLGALGHGGPRRAAARRRGSVDAAAAVVTGRRDHRVLRPPPAISGRACAETATWVNPTPRRRSSTTPPGRLSPPARPAHHRRTGHPHRRLQTLDHPLKGHREPPNAPCSPTTTHRHHAPPPPPGRPDRRSVSAARLPRASPVALRRFLLRHGKISRPSPRHPRRPSGQHPEPKRGQSPFRRTSGSRRRLVRSCGRPRRGACGSGCAGGSRPSWCSGGAGRRSRCSCGGRPRGGRSGVRVR